MANETRLIDANDAEKFAREHILDAKERFLILDFLRECSTVDAAEVVHGRWIVDKNGVVICSECGAEHEWIDYRASFCEDCGTKMDGDGNA